MKFVPLIPLATLLVAAGCSRHEAPHSAPRLPAARVRLAAVQTAELPQLTEVTATVRPVQRAALASKVMGAIVALPVALGQGVRPGDLLVKLSAAEATAKVTQARAQLNVARRDLERERDLAAKGASTAETVRNLEDRHTGCEAMLREAEAQLSYTEIRAPFDGVISRKPANAGDLAVPGQTLVELEETAHFEIEACIPDSLAGALRPGAELACQVADLSFRGTLREWSSAADPTTRTLGVKIAVPAGTGVRSGQFARVQVPGVTRRTLLVPATAISLNGQMERVFVAGEGNRASLRLVKTGAVRGGQIEILSGLGADDRIIIDPPASLRDGQPLEALP